MDGNIDLPVLLVEDSVDDVLIIKKSWKKGCIRNKLFVVNNGAKALQFLHKEGEYANAPTPCLILLDLKMPVMDGFEFLERIKGDEEFKAIPVVVLTSSERDPDIERAYKLGCNSYIMKPVDFLNFIETIVKIRGFWLTLCKLPAR